MPRIKWFKYPWGNELLEEVQRQDSAEFDATIYRKFARPVGGYPQLATPLGIKHMYSNVEEYTEGIAADRNRGVIIKGRSWADSRYHAPSDISVLSGRSLPSIDRGFRIAVSID